MRLDSMGRSQKKHNSGRAATADGERTCGRAATAGTEDNAGAVVDAAAVVEDSGAAADDARAVVPRKSHSQGGAAADDARAVVAKVYRRGRGNAGAAVADDLEAASLARALPTASWSADTRGSPSWLRERSRSASCVC